MKTISKNQARAYYEALQNLKETEVIKFLKKELCDANLVASMFQNDYVELTNEVLNRIEVLINE